LQGELDVENQILNCLKTITQTTFQFKSKGVGGSGRQQLIVIRVGVSDEPGVSVEAILGLESIQTQAFLTP